jgi:nickel transport protein
MTPRLLALVLALAIVLLVTLPAAAHDLWLEPGADGCVLHRGHHHSDHGGEDGIAYDPALVEAVICCDQEGELVRQPAPDAAPLRVPGSWAAVCVQLRSGPWTKTPDGTKNLPRDQVEHPLESWYSRETVKLVSAWIPHLEEPLGEELEIVPLENPLVLGVGDKLRLRVLCAGRPVPEAIVTYDGKPRGVTDADGRINVKVRRAGLQNVQASWRERLDASATDAIVHVAVLNFVPEGSR